MFGRSKSLLDRSFSRLSTGTSVITPKDNQAHFNGGLRASTKVGSTHYAVRNIASGVSLVQTAESSTRELQTNVQRIRELAVQSANGAMPQDTRYSLQVEVDAIIDEINKISESSNVGGIKLLDGSAKSLNFMVGTDVGNVVRLDLKSMTAKDLGRMVRVGGEDIDSSVELQSGDLVINGYSIRGTSVTDDPYSTADAAGSVMAKARAINSSSEFTGVRADVLETLVLGDAIVGGQLDINNHLVINGESIIGAQVEAGDASGELVIAINAVHEKTGVTAYVDEIGALTLTADDGRNITIETTSDFAANATGLNSGFQDTVTTGGALQLVSKETVVMEYNVGGLDFGLGFGNGVGKQYLAQTEDTYLQTVEITSQEEARRTIDIADTALDTLRSQVSDMGALTSRLEYAMQTLTSEQLSAQNTRSQMLDLDFAQEVVELTRQSLAQEAQSAVMAQANTNPDSALTLLDGMASIGFGARGFSSGFGSGAFSSGSLFSRTSSLSSSFSLFG